MTRKGTQKLEEFLTIQNEIQEFWKREKAFNLDAVSIEDKKSKAAAKTGGKKYQWEIMRALGLEDKEIGKFANPNFWLRYFPDVCMSDVSKLGVKADFRRAFITTEENPYYDSFVRWQFLRLKEKGLIKFGKRYTIFSPKDNQPCMDHERSSGEGVCPQEYTLIKLKLLSTPPVILKDCKEEIFLVAATLRPETMYGQTNCWLHPDIEYSAVRSKKYNCIFICTHRSALNMAYQNILDEDKIGQADVIATIKGCELLGAKLAAPLCTKYKEIYALPMMTISSTKGTGVVTSVPSDSPDDFTALRDLKNKKALCEKYGIKEEMVHSYEPIEIIETPNFGRNAAQKVVEDMKIQSQNDKDKLTEAKNLVYKAGFYDGVLLVGPYKGSKIQDVKKKIQDELISQNLALIYYEPEKEVISRSGDMAVVSLCDQWFLEYSSEEWKASTRQALNQLTLTDETRRNLESTLAWLQDHACSRTFGLGTKLPWDNNWIIESLSDSTIYMAYYTIAHLLQGMHNLDGMSIGPIGITPEDMSPIVWDYIFLGHGDTKEILKDCPSITQEKLDCLRKEFEYWYGVDLRVSGKDLIPNHLTYFLYNHVAIWPNQSFSKWPKEIRANGHLLLNSEKMSKQTGNFLTLAESIEKYSSDGIRLALADAGDTLEDANMEESMCEAGFLRLYNLYSWIKTTIQEMTEDPGMMRTGMFSQHADLVFENEMNRIIELSDLAYSRHLFKEVVKLAFYELQSARDRYILVCQSTSAKNLHLDLIKRYIEIQLTLISPICPHITQHLWMKSLKRDGFIHTQPWPKLTKQVSDLLTEEAEYLDESIHKFRLQIKNSGQKKGGKAAPNSSSDKKPNCVHIWVSSTYPEWQMTIIKCIHDNMQGATGELPSNAVISAALKPLLKSMKPGQAKKAMPFVQLVKERYEKGDRGIIDGKSPIDEEAIFHSNLAYLRTSLGIDAVVIRPSVESQEENIQTDVSPRSPIAKFTFEEKLPQFTSIQLKNISNKAFGLFTISNMTIFNGDTVSTLIKRILRRFNAELNISQLSLTDGSIKVKVFRDEKASRSIPPHKAENLIELSYEDVFHVDGSCAKVSQENKSLEIVDKCLAYSI